MNENAKQPEALRLADCLERDFNMNWPDFDNGMNAAAELRRLHALNAELEVKLEAVGAGGVSALMPASGEVAARKPLTDDAKHDLATNFFAEDWLIDKAISLIDDVESAHGIK